MLNECLMYTVIIPRTTGDIYNINTRVEGLNRGKREAQLVDRTGSGSK